MKLHKDRETLKRLVQRAKPVNIPLIRPWPKVEFEPAAAALEKQAQDQESDDEP